MKRNRPKHRPQSPEPQAVRTALPYRGPAVEDRVPVWRRALVLALLGTGVILYALLASVGGGHALGPRRWAVVAVAAAAALVPTAARAVFAALEKVRRPTPRARARTAVLLAVLAAAYFIFTAIQQGRDLFPKTHDDQSYLLQMQMLARGRLWMPQHPLADFFDTFYVLVRPKYASLYFPGAALLYVPTIWLGLPTWLMPVGVAGAIVGLLYRVVAELLDGVAGLLAAAVLTSLSWFRIYSVLLTSHEPMLLMGLLLFWCWLRWRRTRWPAWLLAAGVFAGWGAITRPVDALCFAVPVGLAIARDLLRDTVRAREPKASAPTVATPRRPRFLSAYGPPASAALLVAGAAPFLCLQLVFNHGVTGRWLKTPYTYYLDQDQPNTAFGFHPYDPNVRPKSHLLQKQVYYESFFTPFIKAHQPDTFLRAWGGKYLPMIVDVALPARILLVLLPLGLLGLSGRGLPGSGNARARRVFLAVIPLFLGLYVFNTFFLEHYALQITPAVLLLLLCAGRALEGAWPRARPVLASGFTVGLSVLCLTTLPELNGLWDTGRHPEYAFNDETFVSPTMRAIHKTIEQYTEQPPDKNPGNPGERAVLLFSYTPPSRDRQGDPLFEDPVYNTQTAWPDDARLVLARDLGPERNREIYDYYARTQPDRVFYRFDRNAPRPEDKWVELGDARTLAKRK